MRTTWRSLAAPIVAEVIARVGLRDPRALRKALRDAFPWPDKHNWPYRVYRSEVAIQTGRRKRKLYQRRTKKSGPGQGTFLD